MSLKLQLQKTNPIIMTKEEVIELVDEEAIFYDDLDSAIIGIAERCGMNTVVCYDKDKAIEALKESFVDVELDDDDIVNGLTIEDKKEEMAIDWFYYNTLGAYVGDYTPIFITINS
jgi:hypothetical protein